MIGLDLSGGFYLYLIVWLFTLVILWSREVWRMRKANSWRINKSRLFTCEKCHHTFVSEDDTNITRCPRCNTMCILRKHRDYL